MNEIRRILRAELPGKFMLKDFYRVMQKHVKTKHLYQLLGKLESLGAVKNLSNGHFKTC